MKMHSDLGKMYRRNYMVKSQLRSLAEKSSALNAKIDGETKIDEWAESYITRADAQIDDVSDYMNYRNLGNLAMKAGHTGHVRIAPPLTKALPAPKLPIYGQERQPADSVAEEEVTRTGLSGKDLDDASKLSDYLQAPSSKLEGIHYIQVTGGNNDVTTVAAVIGLVTYNEYRSKKTMKGLIVPRLKRAGYFRCWRSWCSCSLSRNSRSWTTDRVVLMLPSRKEMMAYWFEHPIAGTFIAFGMVEGIKTIWESFVNPKGKSPFSTYTDIRSGAVLDDLGHLTSKQQQDLDEVKKGLKAASKMHAKQSAQLTKASSMHAEQAKQLTAASKMHAGQAKTIEQLGSLHLEETSRQIKLKEVVVPQPPNEAGVDREGWYQGRISTICTATMKLTIMMFTKEITSLEA